MVDLQYLERVAPSVLAEVPASYVSSQYNFVPTIRLVEGLESAGWKVASARQTNARSRDPLTTRHQVSMSLPDSDHFELNLETGTVRPRIEIINSHDWSSRLKILLGIFRLICSNGMVASVGNFRAINIRHDAPLNWTVDNIAREFNTAARQLSVELRRMESIPLSIEKQLEFAQKAKNLRFGEESPVEAHSLLGIRRPTDDGNSLWTVYNVIQENVTKGGVRFNGMRRTSRQLTNIQKDIELNQGLWAIAQEFAGAV